ncbi:MAG: Enolase-phosphatase E1 [Chroococcidiopsis cubana SAG 39.79]|jgi:enolase-phosphatase E1|uniref:Enolase-phosphatase E1 n=1 Tax=Chroococcidiopsis cubana SAG 39.79 TaxID=388085 RepID=A0AB37UDF2_9CYAN|nr:MULTISPECIES: acireductone synthase [Chroococcidiopsis]PSB45883.1 acireductone synthase [Cyanosarcina cf. burmensis CCALA 770]MDZ4873109.1 Enolase-phosphatase E1 [Chroococcidiopsis cubana SAG 39.79]PSB64008.1 acireductone synthase [Chroococcidiopsis cubana CCALA 043]RUT04524.1 enolase-phosphatase E1 [Chroococcidiopsis cubana SAG 39.79]URD50767.1 acireductone synthase [Chroococcidiopsis sp. CCNUC1]
MPDRYSARADIILLDIEGTTTPIDYVFGVLFPFAQKQVEAFLQTHFQESAVQADLERLRQEYAADFAQGLNVPEWVDNSATAAVPYIHYLIATDRKSTGLKSLQGKIWESGYRDGTLRSQLFPDVKPAFERWTREGKRLYIFSSGSVQAQKLLFQYSEAGDLTQFLSGYFDTETGSKKEAESYRKIAQAIGVLPTQILFISDVTAELKAAKAAGMRTLFSLRSGNRTSDSEGFPVIHNFDSV